MAFALLQAIGVGFAVIAFVVVAIVVASVVVSAVKVVKEYERGVIFRLGRVQGGRRVLVSSCFFRSWTTWSR
jgi:regulator of protease activity HflC (stomatin/prohibitin superfamily)